MQLTKFVNKRAAKLLGTVCSIEADVSDAVFDRALELVVNFEQRCSRFIPGNELDQVNSCLGKWQQVSTQILELIIAAKRIQDQTNGAFDLTVCSYLEKWGYDRDYSLKPNERVEAGLGSVNIDGDKILITAPIDLGGIGKGFAIDLTANFLRQHTSSFFVNFGGDIWAEGNQWQAPLAHPLNQKLAIGKCIINQFALACSSANRRNWRNFHHIVDPQTSEPAQHDLVAVFVQAQSAAIADAYATAIFSSGVFKQEYPVSALLIKQDGSYWQSPNFKAELF